MKICFITDMHVGKGNDSLIHDAYFERFYTEVFWPTLWERQIHTIIDLGDMFDRRRFVNFQIYSNFTRYFKKPLQLRHELHSIIGNHNIYHNETNSLNNMKLLMGDAATIYERATEVVFDGLKLLFIPWITKENSEHTMQMIRDTDARYALGHLDIHGFEMDKGHINQHGLDRTIFNKFEKVWSGHFHHESEDGNIHYLGTCYEQTWADCDDRKSFFIFDTDTKELERIVNPLSLYKKFFYDDVNNESAIQHIIDTGAEDFRGKYVKIMIENRTQHSMFDAVHKLISSAGVHDISVIDKMPEFVISEKISSQISESVELTASVGSEDTGKIISAYVSSARYPAHIDPSRVSAEMDDLYKEANQLRAEI